MMGAEMLYMFPKTVIAGVMILASITLLCGLRYACKAIGKVVIWLGPLQGILNVYFWDYVKIRAKAMNRAERVLSDIKRQVLWILQRELPHFEIRQLETVGSTVENLKVVRPDGFNVLVRLHLKPGARCITNDVTIQAPGYSLIGMESECHRSIHKYLEGSYLKNLDEVSSDGEPNHKYQRSQYLSPKKIRSEFQRILQQFVLNHYLKYSISVSSHNPTALNVLYDKGQHMLVDLVPVVNIDGQDLMAQPPPLVQKKTGGKELLLWMKSYSAQEAKKIASITKCQRKCLMIMKAVRLNNPEKFGPVSSYVLKSILLHLAEKKSGGNDANGNQLHDRKVLVHQLQRFLQEMINVLGRGHLQPYFEEDPRCNLLEVYDRERLMILRNFLWDKKNRREIHTLLRENY